MEDLRDIIRVNDLQASVLLSTGAAWPPKGPKPTLQPITITAAFPHDVRQTAETDDLNYSVSYSTIASSVRNSIQSENNTFQSLEHLCQHIFDSVLHSPNPLVKELSLRIVQLKAPVHCRHVGLEASSNGSSISQYKTFLQGIQVPCIIGINKSEREETQDVLLDITISGDPPSLQAEYWVNFRGITRAIYEKVGNTAYLTLEALVTIIASWTLEALPEAWRTPSTSVKVRGYKPSALVFASSSEVQVQRTFADFETSLPKAPASSRGMLGKHIVAIAFGSNLGDRVQTIETALTKLENPGSWLKELEQLEMPIADVLVDVVNTSFLYQTTPMYVDDQPPFLNGACMVETNLTPIALLYLLKALENESGRVPTIRNGPRALDLDILLYDDIILREDPEFLAIPHPRIHGREFVLRPLADMIPDFVHPSLGRTIATLLQEVTAHSADPSMEKILPFPRHPVKDTSQSPETLTQWTYAGRTSKTHLMATLNATPDSFSDGSTHNTVSTGLDYARTSVMAGAGIIDVGGYSTRPGAVYVSSEEEIARIEPIIKAIRADDATANIPVSIDTFRVDVSKAALLAGANCINDVYAFTGPDGYSSPTAGEQHLAEMRALAREFAVPCVLMHSRGDAGQNKDYGDYSYADLDMTVVEGVRVELGNLVEKIVRGKGGLRRWLVVVDPGVGFSKTVEGNLQLLRNAKSVVADVRIGQGEYKRRNPLAGYPLLIGTSRKSFLGTILEKDGGRSTRPDERVFATATTVACAVQQKSLIVRVHDAQEMSDVIRVSEALWN